MKILILCTGNSCRSQMAQVILQSFDKEIEVVSAGTRPAKQVHKFALKMLEDLNLSIDGLYPKMVDEFLEESFDYVISVCGGAKETCPTFIGNVKNRIHIGFEDPDELKGKDEDVLKEFKRIRNEIYVDFHQFYKNNIKK